MGRVVSDSGPLIWLAKIDRLRLLRLLFGEVIIPAEVERETVSGRSADSMIIGEALAEGWMSVSRVGADEAVALVGVSGLHLGEAEAILLARRIGALFLVDEREASSTARVFGVRAMGTVGVLLLALREGHLVFDEFVECLDLLVAGGFWLSVDVYKKALDGARSITGAKGGLK
jgi:predicted nucleic acid-binding protein